MTFFKKKHNAREVATDRFEGDQLVAGEFAGEENSRHRYFGRTIERCSFERCKFTDLRMWRTSIIDTKFTDCSLRDAALGGIQDGQVNRFQRVSFARVDFWGTAWKSGEMTDCRFDDCRLDKVDFQGVRFVRCSFSGELREVMFYDQGFGATDQPKNEMVDCDFSRARLRWVAFRRLNLGSIVPPLPENGYAVSNYRTFLETAISHSTAEEQSFKKMMEHFLRWAGPRQEQGFFGLAELTDLLGTEWRRRMDELQRIAAGGAPK